MSNKTLKYISFTLISFLCIWGCAEYLHKEFGGGFAGSYSFVETWTINASEKEVIDAIIELKKENKFLQPPNQTLMTEGRKEGYVDGFIENLKPHRNDIRPENDKLEEATTVVLPPHDGSNSYGDETNGWKEYWYFIDFYYNDTKEIVHTWTRPSHDSTMTTLALIGYSKINKPKSYKYINRDFMIIPNKLRKAKFEELIVAEINRKIKITSPLLSP